MHGRSGVGVVEGARDRPQQSDDPQRVVAHARAQHFVKSLAGNHLGDQIRKVAVVGELIQARDGGVLERDV